MFTKIMASESSCGFDITINSLNLPTVAKMLGKTQGVLHISLRCFRQYFGGLQE
jgi:hypothetical protein